MKLKDILKDLGFTMGEIKTVSIFVNDELTKDLNMELNIHPEFRMDMGDWMFFNGQVSAVRMALGMEDDFWIRIRVGKNPDNCWVFMVN